MKKTEKYGSTLKKLLCFTDTKFVVLSKIVGYDISYISKWCSNNKIPTPKNIRVINEKASIIFSKEIIKQNKDREFYELFEIKEPMEQENLTIEDMLKSQIYNLLENAYKKSEFDLSGKSEKKHKENKVIIGKNQVTNFIREIISTTIENSTTDIELLSTIDICKGTANINLDTMEEYKVNDIRVSAKVGFDMDEFEMNPNFYLWRIYFILNKKWNMEFEFFDNKDIDKLNIIAIRDKFAITCSLDSDGLIEVATVITDKEIVNAIYDKTISKFKMGDVLVRSIENSELNQSGYRTDFYANDEFQFVSTKGFEFLLPSEIIPDITEAACKQGFDGDISFLIRKLQITWEERFEKSKINFIILKSALMKYIENGEIFYTNIMYNLSTEQRKNHVLKAVESMRKNSNIKITILDDELLNYDVDFFKISINANNKKIFLKKNLKNVYSEIPIIYTIINEKLVRHINECLLFIKNMDLCVEYNADEIELALEKYGTMFLRMIEAKNYNK
ncbi:hypothetical protein OW763_16285 [Clostridium aestuarii]|uniref:Transcriptional regulator n=1 Tax=Clostridium aestuarii TaxID=338193 RepID=A0ABT4D6R7_9CLOT|nr:hypothetical protein [Clostridium aestuarii]MCY6485870.1 hypothetical protein [Clostridium aestuarii]